MCCILARCWSYVGKAQASEGQSLSIGHGCGSISTVLHELMHALGFFHTSSRYDRDSYVIVRQDNIIQGKGFSMRFLADCRKRYVFVNVCITALPYGQKEWKKIDH